VIRYAFDHHQCSDCAAEQRPHRIAARLLDGEYFWFCTGCGQVEGPYAQLPSGERAAIGERDAETIEDIDAIAAAEIEQETVAALVDELSVRFEIEDREALVAAIVEARSLRESASSAEAREMPAADHLRAIIDRAERLLEERASVNGAIRDLMSFAKEIGFNPKAIRHVIDARAELPELRKLKEAEFAVYRNALGIEGPEYAVALPTPLIEAAKPRAIPKKVQQRRDSVALAALAEMARGS